MNTGNARFAKCAGIIAGLLTSILFETSASASSSLLCINDTDVSALDRIESRYPNRLTQTPKSLNILLTHNRETDTPQHFREVMVIYRQSSLSPNTGTLLKTLTRQLTQPQQNKFGKIHNWLAMENDITSRCYPMPWQGEGEFSKWVHDNNILGKQDLVLYQSNHSDIMDQESFWALRQDPDLVLSSGSNASLSNLAQKTMQLRLGEPLSRYALITSDNKVTPVSHDDLLRLADGSQLTVKQVDLSGFIERETGSQSWSKYVLSENLQAITSGAISTGIISGLLLGYKSLPFAMLAGGGYGWAANHIVGNQPADISNQYRGAIAPHYIYASIINSTFAAMREMAGTIEKQPLLATGGTICLALGARIVASTINSFGGWIGSFIGAGVITGGSILTWQLLKDKSSIGSKQSIANYFWDLLPASQAKDKITDQQSD